MQNNYLDSRTPQERQADSEIKSITTTSMDKITINTVLGNFREKLGNPENTGYRVGQEFMGAVENYIIHALRLYSEAVKLEIDATVPNNAYSAGWNTAVDEQRRKDKEFWEESK
jgi:hypothetical protein